MHTEVVGEYSLHRACTEVSVYTYLGRRARQDTLTLSDYFCKLITQLGEEQGSCTEYDIFIHAACLKSVSLHLTSCVLSVLYVYRLFWVL